MLEQKIYVRALSRAVAVVGDTERLAHRLHVPHPALLKWLEQAEPMPAPVFLRVVDIVLAHAAGESDRGLPPAGV
jgi:hypothetical protein